MGLGQRSSSGSGSAQGQGVGWCEGEGWGYLRPAAAHAGHRLLALGDPRLGLLLGGGAHVVRTRRVLPPRVTTPRPVLEVGRERLLGSGSGSGLGLGLGVRARGTGLGLEC